MADDLLKRYTAPPAAGAERGGLPGLPPEYAKALAPRPPMLSVVFRGGNRVALPYGYLVFVLFDPSTGLVLRFATHTVRVEGVRLESLYGAVLAQTLPELAETADEFEVEPGEGPRVERVTVEEE